MQAEESIHTILAKMYPQDYIKDVAVRLLDSGGSHFSSDVKEIKIKIENGKGRIKMVHLVMKSLPSLEKQIQHSSKLGLQKEIDFYTVAVSAYMNLQQNKGLVPENIFPELLYASKTEIVLEDLRMVEFSGLQNSLDEEHTFLVLRSLAKFHATGIALKRTDEDFFATKLSHVLAPALRNASNEKREDINETFRYEVFTLLTSMEDCQQYAKPVVELLQNIDSQKLPQPREPFATVLHNDLWRGNVQFKYSIDHRPVEIKLIDFQTTIYNSPARELAYFLCTSVEQEVFDMFDQMVSFYHQAFVDYLTKLGCETKEFTLESLIEEIKVYGPTKLKHIILLHKSISNLSTNSELIFKQFLRRVVFMFKERQWL